MPPGGPLSAGISIHRATIFVPPFAEKTGRSPACKNPEIVDNGGWLKLAPGQQRGRGPAKVSPFRAPC